DKLTEFISIQNSGVYRKKVSADVERLTLDNGLQIYMKKVKGKPSVGVSLTYKVSQLNETVKERGLNLLTAGSMLYGNEKRNYQQMVKYCSSNGINLGITPHMETTTLKLKCFREMLPTTLELMQDIIYHPTFPSEHIENLKQTYISNLNRIQDYPTQLNNKLWRQLLFGKQSNLVDRQGNKTSLKAINRSRILKWYRKYYQPQNMVLAIVGNIAFDEIGDICNRLLSTTSSTGVISEQKAILSNKQMHYKKTKKEISQSIIQIGGWACSASQQKENTAFYVLSEILGGDLDSLLFNELREKRGLAYSVDFSFSAYKKFGYWAAAAIVDKKNEKLALKTIKTVLKKLQKDEISDYELQKVKNYIRGQRLQEDESLLNQAITISNLISIGLNYEYYLNRDKRLQEVSKDIIHKLAQLYFNKDNFYTHILL
ncbi:MAG: pitrilysin family protein, partial [Candidatus Cloacimonadota bacterium]|nr:pitrilysin family protein [Candidatus Cloacimonadota bacterium]